MKNRLNITIDQVLMEEAKRYATKHNTSVSQLVEGFFESLTQAKKENILELLDRLPEPKGRKPKEDLKKLYYEGKKKKYGF
ncbi:MAG: DUF6364 family protein [Chitinophagaceae bacterium]|nr:hypothetical protein [Chitinophagaceae bacterium]MDX1955958.1 DUF6364 family protein [Chitinophagaceae bacterium]